MPDHLETDHADPASIYRRLGVEPVINCGASRSFYGNSCAPDEVRAAMDAAARSFVLMPELAEAIGARLAELTGAEWGLVTAGTAGGLALAAAACVAANDPLRMLRLPLIDGMPDVVLAPQGHRFAYDQAIRLTGCRIVEVADRQELDAALATHPVAMFSVFGERDATSVLKLEDLIAAARPRGIPILVDAASEFLTVPEPWLARGADLVIYSVGKVMRGPAATGLLLGRKDLVRAAWFNGPPNQSFGRAMKISKEQMVGAVAALERWLALDQAAERRRWLDRLSRVEAQLAGLDGVTAEIEDVAGAVPRLRVRWDLARQRVTLVELRQELLARRPRVLIDDFGGSETSAMINPFGLTDEEAVVVGASLRAALGAVRPDRAGRTGTPQPVAGHWDAALAFATGPQRHRLDIEQEDGRLTGWHRTPFGAAPLQGDAGSDGFSLEAIHMVEGNYVRFGFTGRLDEPGRMRGRVLMGAAAVHTRGPVTYGQFGEIPWEAAPAAGRDEDPGEPARHAAE